MHENRKQIIIQEIAYWKKNKLLPEHYCNFLLALYTEGNGLQEEGKPLNRRKYWLFFLLMVPLSAFLFYFTELSLILQMIFAIILILFGIYLTFILYKRGLLFQIPLIAAAFLLLFASVEITLTTYPENMISLYIVLGSNCLLWLISGWKLKQLYFIISGILGMFLLVASIVVLYIL